MKKSIISLLIIVSLLCSTVCNICFANNTEKKELLVGFSTPFAPFQENINDELVGYDVDVMNYICSQLNLEPKYIDVPDFMDLLPMLFSGEIDCVTSLGTSEERMTKFDFTRPYYVGTFIDPEDPTNDELVRWSIAFPKGSSYTNQFNDIILKAEKNGTLQKMASKYNLSHTGTDAVINGDFSAVAGTYKNSYNEEIKLYENGLDEWRLNNEYFEYKIEHIWEDGGSYQWIIVPYDPYDKDVALEGYRMIIYPENVEVKTVGGEIVQSDTSKIRLWCGNGDVYDNQYIYYKQDEALSDATNALFNGDFSEFSGIYKYNSGNSFELLANGLSNLDISDEETEFRVEDITKCSDGTYMWSVNCYYYGECIDGAMCILYPKGVEVVSYDGRILPTDTTKVRFWSGNAEVSDVQYIAYKQDETVDEIKVVLNGEEIEFDQPPVMINDRVMVPIRAVAEKMGDTVKWSGYLNSALIVHADRMVIFKNNSEQALIYADPTESSTWSSYYCDVPPQVINDRTLTPVRAIGECLGAKVDWDGDTQTVIINYDKNTPNTLKDNAFTQLNAYYSSLLQASDFTTCSDEINEFYNSRSNWSDTFIIFWDDWTISLDILASGEKTNVYMLKNCFAEILSKIPDSDVKDFDVYTEILDWLSKTSKLADIDFTKVDKVVNISVQTANSLSKFGNAIDKAGTALDFTGVGIDVLAELLSDYSTGMLYIDTLRNSFKNSGIEDEVVYAALDELENDYVNKCANTLIENATSMSSSALLKLITSGAFNVASFGKDILNWVVDNDDKADAVKNINCIYLFNEYIDKAYSDVRNNLIADPTEIDDYIRLFNFQKIVKTKMYESMDRLRKKSDQYTQTRISEQLDKLKKTSYIIWE